MIDLVNVDLRRGSLVVSSYSTTTAGFEVMNGWFVSLGGDVTDEALGGAVREALSHCRHDVPVPPRDSNPIAPLLEGVGVKSWAQYAKDVKAVSVRSNDTLTIVPTENRGRDGFVEISDKTIPLAAGASAAELGKAVRNALAQAR
jgi:hypothetical protein